MDDRYFAGLFDGEGSINALMNYKENYFTIRLQFGMADSALPLTIRVHQQYGGILFKRRQSHRNINWQDATYITWTRRDAVEETLDKIEPYLDLKKEQAKLALWWLKSNHHSFKYGMDEAKKEFVSSLKLMKKSPYSPAEEAIFKIKACFNSKLRLISG